MWPGDQTKEGTSSNQESYDDQKPMATNNETTPSISGEPNEAKSKQSDRDSRPSLAVSSGGQSARLRSSSRDSSLNDDPKSLIDSISAASGRNHWSGREVIEDDPSISSIKGDSISATMADYDRKYRVQTSDNQSRTSAGRHGVENELLHRTDDLSTNINFFTPGGSTRGIIGSNQPCSSSRPGDFVSVSSNNNIDAFDIIEESSNVSPADDLSHSIPSYDNLHHRANPTTRHSTRTAHNELEQALDIDDLPQEVSVYQIEPIILRGNGNLTLFGLSNSFASEFPSALIGRVSKEEFDHTMRRVNALLRDQQSLSAKLLLFGGLCCCCSLGFSLVWPSVALKKRSKISLQKFLASENSRLYSKLGLNWKLAEQRCYSNHAFIEYVLMIEFTPKINLYHPD